MHLGRRSRVEADESVEKELVALYERRVPGNFRSPVLVRLDGLPSGVAGLATDAYFSAFRIVRTVRE